MRWLDAWGLSTEVHSVSGDCCFKLPGDHVGNHMGSPKIASVSSLKGIAWGSLFGWGFACSRVRWNSLISEDCRLHFKGFRLGKHR